MFYNKSIFFFTPYVTGASILRVFLELFLLSVPSSVKNTCRLHKLLKFKVLFLTCVISFIISLSSFYGLNNCVFVNLSGISFLVWLPGYQVFGVSKTYWVIIT